MAIKRQEFYEGAALHILARSGGIRSLRYDWPMFVVNDDFSLHIKYSRKGRSPWGFTFMPDERKLIEERARNSRLVLGLVCGSDGVVALPYEEYSQITPATEGSVYMSCYRSHGEFYEVNGPEGILSRKIAPSAWQKLLGSELE